MQINTYLPHPVLTSSIECYWSLSTSATSITEERVVPNGRMQMIFHLGNRFTEKSESHCLTQPDFFICGQKTTYSDVIASGNSDMIAVVFAPSGVASFIKNPMADFPDELITMDCLFGREADLLAEQLYECKENKSRVSILDNFFLGKLFEQRADQKTIESAWRYIEAKNGQPTVDHLADRFCMSKRTLERKFNHYIGLSPKKFSRIARFGAVSELLKQTDTEKLSDVCYDLGYFDHSHLVNDFKELSGYTPSDYNKLFGK